MRELHIRISRLDYIPSEKNIVVNHQMYTQKIQQYALSRRDCDIGLMSLII